LVYVLTSAAPRAIETAVAMGVAVDDAVDLPSGYVPGEVGFHEQWTWAQPWVRYAELLGRGGGLAAVAGAHRAAWTRAVASVADGAAALVVSHGGAIEPTLVVCLPKASHEPWGALLGHCDGARLGFADGSLSSSASAERRPCQRPEHAHAPRNPLAPPDRASTVKVARLALALGGSVPDGVGGLDVAAGGGAVSRKAMIWRISPRVRPSAWAARTNPRRPSAARS
jgi:broad specificity phosphatase PhoE